MRMPHVPEAVAAALLGGWLLVAAPIADAAPTTPNGPSSKLQGEWRGRSLCTTSRPACTDETVVYRITQPVKTAESFRIAAHKIVGGEEQFMGDLDCQFQTLRQLLVCPQGSGTWTFRWDGDALLGDLHTTDEGLFRLIHVRRVTSAG